MLKPNILEKINTNSSQTQKWCLYFLSGILCILLVYNQSLSSLIYKYQKVSNELKISQTQSSDIEKYQIIKQEIKKQTSKIQQQLLLIDTALPTNWNLAKLNSEIDLAIDFSQLTIQRQTYSNEVRYEHHAILPIYLELSGQYHELIKFVNAINRLKSLVNIRKLEIENPTNFHKSPKLFIKIQLNAYRRSSSKLPI